MSDKSNPPSIPGYPSQAGNPQARASIMPEEQDAQPAPLEVGQVVARKYRLDRLLGAGGMGYVALATHLQLDQRVALKFLRPETAKRKDLVKRFALEARAAAKIRGDHVAKVTDVDELEDGTPFMVMEYLEGEDLSERLTRLGRLDFRQAAAYVLEACEAIGEAHSMRIIHRDLKPSNLFLAARPDGSEMVKVLDFGISKMLEDSAAGITQTQTSFGSIPYMAPEQMRDARHCDERTDIWALGVTFYELVTQNYPFPGTTGPEVIARVMEGSLVPVEQLRPDAPPLVRRVVALCTQRDPSQRYVDIGELAMDLAGVVGTETARERATRIMRLVAPGMDQLGTLNVDVMKRGVAAQGGAPLQVIGSAQPAPGPALRAATAPLGPALIPPAAQGGSSAPSSSTGAAAGPVVLAPAFSSTGGAPPRSPFLPAMAVGAAVALALVGVGAAIFLVRSAPSAGASSSPAATSAPAQTASASTVAAAPVPVPPPPHPPEQPASVDAGAKAASHGPAHPPAATTPTPPSTPAAKPSPPTVATPTVATPAQQAPTGQPKKPTANDMIIK